MFVVVVAMWPEERTQVTNPLGLVLLASVACSLPRSSQWAQYCLPGVGVQRLPVGKVSGGERATSRWQPYPMVTLQFYGSMVLIWFARSRVHCKWFITIATYPLLSKWNVTR